MSNPIEIIPWLCVFALVILAIAVGVALFSGRVKFTNTDDQSDDLERPPDQNGS
ncbi:MAG TPA: hypothetical protein VJB17_04650 [Patescibacteria group bacterium]|nr:hypothetical protein [Patescibacteria group bacterium]